MSNEPIFSAVNTADPAYQVAIERAQALLPEFRSHCRRASATGAIAFVKKEVREGEARAFLWFSDASPTGDDFNAEVFEVPAEFKSLRIGQRVVIRASEVLDWMVNDAGRLHGGFSLRYQRERLALEKRAWFDQQIGVTEYL